MRFTEIVATTGHYTVEDNYVYNKYFSLLMDIQDSWRILDIAGYRDDSRIIHKLRIVYNEYKTTKVITRNANSC